jgi:hypothetical protein
VVVSESPWSRQRNLKFPPTSGRESSGYLLAGKCHRALPWGIAGLLLVALLGTVVLRVEKPEAPPHRVTHLSIPLPPNPSNSSGYLLRPPCLRTGISLSARKCKTENLSFTFALWISLRPPAKATFFSWL